MFTTETVVKLKTENCAESCKVSVIIVCGGSSQRMKGIDKIFTEIGGMPVAAHSISAFNSIEKIDNIVVVTKDESILKMQQLCQMHEFSKVTDIVAGGSCRQESVANGLSYLSNDTDIVLIHDGARPFVKADLILRVIDAVKCYSAVTCAVNVKDTLKHVRSDGMVTATPDRAYLKAVQTPQGFDFNLYKSAVYANKDRLQNFTDDCSVIESQGVPVFVVEGDYNNIKITTVEDLKFADFLLKDLI